MGFGASATAMSEDYSVQEVVGYSAITLQLVYVDGVTLFIVTGHFALMWNWKF